MHTALPRSVPAPRNLVEHLRALARERGEQAWLTVVGGREAATPRTLSYGVLDQRVRALAALLQQRGVVGERALLMLDNDEHYVIALLACFYSGVIAVPVLRPRAGQPQHLQRLSSVAADARARCVLTIAAHAASARQLGLRACIDVDRVALDLAAEWQAHAPADQDIAFLQYTSGSTSAPKGVMLTHANLLANLRAMQCVLGLGPHERIVSWQPLYHDMGLIGGLLCPLWIGAPLILTSPEYFLERPARWLELISAHRATGSAGPDFAYRLCVERIKSSQLARLDLSTWRVALTGAEPIRSDTVRRFCAKFAAAGFDPRALRACYGLAEATLMASVSSAAGIDTREFCSDALRQHRASVRAGGTRLVSCGSSVPEHEICIVDPVTRDALPESHVGEIWLRGPSIARGYWAHPQSTADTFVTWRDARWLRTGDLGFLREGELYVTGRRKDLIIVRGHNIHAHDVEQAIELAVSAVRAGRVAAFPVEYGGREGIGVAAEVGRGEQQRNTPAALVEALSAAVSEACGEPLTAVALLNPGGMPRTSSGKLQRATCRKAWVERTLDAYALFEQGRLIRGALPEESTATLDEMQSALAAIWREVLHWDASFAVSPHTHFFASGGNSLSAVQVAQRIAVRWEVELTASDVFAQPRLAQLAEQIERLRSAQRHALPPIAVLPRRSAGLPLSQVPDSALPRSHAPDSALPLSHAPDSALLLSHAPDSALPLSHAQERQWFLWRLDPASSAYHVNLALRLRGWLRLDELRAALHAVSMRHETLRTVFKIDAEGVVGQYVLPECECDIEVLDAGGADARSTDVWQRLQARVRQPFDLTRGPLLRVLLVQADQDEWLLALTMHHIVSDAGSMQILVAELLQRYQGLCAGTDLPLAAPRIQYVDYAAWLRDWLAGGEAERELRYWCEQLGSSQPVLALPADRPRQPLARYRAGTHVSDVAVPLAAELRQLAQAHDATLFMTLLAAFAVLLQRYSGEDDLRIGVPVANRQHADTAALVGLFVNTLVLRVRLQPHLSFSDLLAQVRTTALAAQAHAHLPFERLVEALQPQRSLSHGALFQVMFNHLQEDLRVLPPGLGLALEVLPMGEGDAQFEMMLDVRERSDGTLRLIFTYAAELFEPRTVARMADHYATLLAGLTVHAARPLHELPLLTSVEQARLRTLWAADPALAELTPVHELIESQAQLEPQSLALLCTERSISHESLARWSNQLARQLLDLGLAAASRVAVRLERGAAQIAALLACLKSGAVYVPLDPLEPPARVLEILRDCGARVLIAAREEPGLAALPAAVRALHLDANPPRDEDLRGLERAPYVELHPHDLAYLIYTSGTTGRPKAVAVEHGALSAHVQAMLVRGQFTRQDRVLQFAPVQVDAALEQALVPLAAGGALVLQPQWCSRAAELAAVCLRQRITVLDLPPTYARQLLQDAAVFEWTPRLVLCGGEPWTWEDLHLLRRVLQPEQLINAYGPTEAVITPALLRVSAAAAASCEPLGAYVPIGAPIGTRSAQVLDAQLQPVPEGIPGELYLGGEHALARGYFERPALTAERFIADPQSVGGRLYRTGDLVRWREHPTLGVQLEYLQRLDQQLKVRGLRIEPGEIEAQLKRLPRVQQAVVTARRDRHSLVAYVVLEPGEHLEGMALRHQLQAVLPDYMVPVVLVVEHLPLNAAGKVDLRALLETPLSSHGESSHVESTYVEPEGAVARMLAALWSQVLGVERVGLHDNFFDLGGNSLLLMRLQASLEQRYDTSVTLTDLFKFPTVAALAQHLERGQSARADAAERDGEQRAVLKRSALARRAHAARLS